MNGDGGRDPAAAARRARTSDRDETVYARKRARKARERARKDAAAFDPSPPTDEDMTVPEAGTDGVRRISHPIAVGEVLDQLIRRRGWEERLRSAAAWERWGDIVGPEMARRCEPVRLAGRVLVVRAQSQVWATQLRYLTTQLRSNAIEVLGPDTVREVRIVVGPLELGGSDIPPD